MINAKRIADLLNGMAEVDPLATAALIVSRVRCNAELLDHPFVICGYRDDDPGQYSEVGILGVLNGLLLSIGERYVVSVEVDGGFAFRKFHVVPYTGAFPADDPLTHHLN